MYESHSALTTSSTCHVPCSLQSAQECSQKEIENVLIQVGAAEINIMKSSVRRPRFKTWRSFVWDFFLLTWIFGRWSAYEVQLVPEAQHVWNRPRQPSPSELLLTASRLLKTLCFHDDTQYCVWQIVLLVSRLPSFDGVGQCVPH